MNAHFKIAAELNIRTATCHVGGDGHCTRNTSLRDNKGFLLVITGIQNLEALDALFAQSLCQKFRLFNRRCADENRLALCVRSLNVTHNGFVFFFNRTINFVVFIETLDRQVGRNFQNFQTVDVAEFFRFRRSCTGHAGELGVHTEIVLERDRSQRLIFRLDCDVFLGFQCLMQTFRETAARHHTAGEFVDDDDFVVADDVVLVTLEQFVSAQRVVQVVNDSNVFDVVKAFTLEVSCSFKKLFNLFGADFCKDRGFLFFIDFKIFRLKSRNESVDEVVEIRTVFEWTGNDQRRTRFVDEDRIHFVDDGVVVTALDHLGTFVLHVIA